MFDIGFLELTLIGVVALLVVGPERLPELARTVGFWVGRARRMVTQVKDDVERELRMEELRRSLDEAKELREAYTSLEDTKQDLNEFARELDQSVDVDPSAASESSASGSDADAKADPYPFDPTLGSSAAAGTDPAPTEHASEPEDVTSEATSPDAASMAGAAREWASSTSSQSQEAAEAAGDQPALAVEPDEDRRNQDGIDGQRQS